MTHTTIFFTKIFYFLASKTKFMTLAKKFMLTKKDPKMLPTIYGDQTTNFTYDIHVKIIFLNIFY